MTERSMYGGHSNGKERRRRIKIITYKLMPVQSAPSCSLPRLLDVTVKFVESDQRRTPFEWIF